MRGARLGLCLLGLLLALGAVRPAAAERIADFQVDVSLQAEDRFSVTERIVWNFEERRDAHGIFREIPLAYGRGRAADYHVGIEVRSVTDANGSPRPYQVKRSRNLLRIRIGAPNRVVEGRQEYRIEYVVTRGVLFFDDHDEVYWNATGNAWKVPIDRAGARVRLPMALSEGVRAACFTGRLGAVESACTTVVEPDAVRFEASRPLGPGEGLSLVVGLPRGVVREPSRTERLLARALDYVSGWTLLPAVVLAVMFALWRATGRDPAGGAAIPVRYEPPEGLSPAEVGVVLDERADMADITATILDLAVRGHLRIEEIESDGFLFLKNEDYRLHRVREADESGLRKHEKLLMQDLFAGAGQVKVSALKNRFYTHLPALRQALYRSVSREKGLFPVSPDRVRRLWLAIGGLVELVAFGAFFFGANASASAALFVSGAVVLGFSFAMPRRTRTGRRVYEEILGFKEFVERVDADRLEREGTRTPERFERVLPYAVVLGVADAWAAAFDGIYREPPSWYAGRRTGAFATRAFVSDLGRSLQTLGSTMTSRPRSSGSGRSGFSSGGGFSGGGFGGGGGGSW